MKLIEHSDRYGLIAACCAAQGDIENACHWQKQAVELHKLCIGTDSDEFEEDEKQLREYETVRLREEAKD